MKKETINIGSYENDPSAESIRSAFDKTQKNFNLLLTNSIKPVSFGTFTVYKAEGNNKNGIEQDLEIEVGDVGVGWLDDGVNFIAFGKYLGGDIGSMESWAASPLNWEE